MHLYGSLFRWQVIGNTAIKHQRPYRHALVLKTPYFDPKYLAIDCGFAFQTIYTSKVCT